MLSMPVMEQVHQRAGQNQQVRKKSEKMGAVFGPQEKGSNGQESVQNPPAAPDVGSLGKVHIVHGYLQ
ncbi:hypothetical protein BOBR111200_09350 [Bordetella bronchialis]|uniref:Uncharacterized protein n=1 Tax=Bordetella bronchialis TaxID=463025 RepID=A0ABN4R1H0_9BORD|nr:hypothetical protein BAU06_13265 [Bordetella bronchialis]